MRGEYCNGFVFLVSLTSIILLAFIYASQANPSLVPRGTSMANVDMSRYHDALFAAFGGVIPIDGLYAQEGSTLGNAAGLRQEYRFGLTNYCAYVDGKHSACGKQAAASKFQPYAAIISDMPLNYSQFSNAVIPPSKFSDDEVLGSFARTASYMLLLGFVFVGLTLITSVFKRFTLATLTCVLANLFLLLGAALWTTAVKKAQSINGLTVSASPTSTPFPLGIVVSAGTGLSLTWAVFGLMMASLVPSVIICQTYRGH